MRPEVISGLLAIGGTIVGWLLSEVGAGWRGWSDRHRSHMQEDAARVLDARSTAIKIAIGVQELVKVDAFKRIHGEGISREEYTVRATELNGQLQRLYLLSLAIRSYGPKSAVADIDSLLHDAQRLIDDFGQASRAETGEDPTRFLARCEGLRSRAEGVVARK